MKKTTSFFYAMIFFSTTLQAASTSEPSAKPAPAQITLRHIEPGGVGYKQGYTTIAGFFTPFWSGEVQNWVPFLDLRAHVFNDDRFASNAGIGLRYLKNSYAFGINTYYDFRQTSRRNYNQISAGFEALGKIWDFRMNGYLPVGGKNSSFYHTHFSEFKGHHAILSRTRDFVMKGANAEIGAHVDSLRNTPLYFAGGPYYLTGKGKSAWGGQFRTSIDLFGQYICTEGNISSNRGLIRLAGNVSYDPIFKWIGQGELSLNIALGGKKSSDGKRCSKSELLITRALQKVDRMEIIPIDTRHIHKTAINPQTGEPYFFWFVNNTSSSLGTIESPFPTLAQAQNASSPGDVIYVLPGDGTTNGMNAGIILQDDQKFWGSGVDHSLATQFGSVKIPPQTSAIPLMTNTGGDGITLANGNEVSGFSIASASGSGIYGEDISSATILDTSIYQSGVYGIYFNETGGNSNLMVNRVDLAYNTSAGLAMGSSGSANVNLTIINSSISNNITHGIAILGPSSSSNATVNTFISNNQINGNIGNGGSGTGNGIFVAEKFLSVNQEINNNTISNNALNGIYCFQLATPTVNQTISNNDISDNGSIGISVSKADLGIGLLNQFISNNRISGNGTNGFMSPDQTGSHANNITSAIIECIGNTFSGNNGIDLTVQNGNTMCLDLQNNSSDLGYALDNAAGTFYLVPTNAAQLNSGAITTSGTITPASSCP